MKVSIICVGKIKEQYLNLMIADYSKRLSKYCKLEIHEVKDIAIKDASQAGILQVLDQEGQAIAKYLKQQAFKVCLCIEGARIDSTMFAKQVDKWFINHNHLQFVIGGSYGLSKQIKAQCNYKLSISDLTFPHNLVRPLILEQIYRCFKINHNEEYHK